jgi:hypothetical protein
MDGGYQRWRPKQACCDANKREVSHIGQDVHEGALNIVRHGSRGRLGGSPNQRCAGKISRLEALTLTFPRDGKRSEITAES